MPFFHFDTEEAAAEFGSDIFDEAAADAESETEPLKYTYQPGEGSFNASQIHPVNQGTYEALVSLGVTGFSATFDGGYDEGFAYFVAAVTPAGIVAVEGLVDRLQEADSQFGKSRADAARRLDGLAADIATNLVGYFFGTGEYALYGAYDVDFATGKITDNPDAVKGKSAP